MKFCQVFQVEFQGNLYRLNMRGGTAQPTSLFDVIIDNYYEYYYYELGNLFEKYFPSA